ncbi:MAG: pyridoxamine 5'-phosphate oxidase [Flavobacteriales bacterium]|nr:pyridoxamine 5'-phosphate oxidase [Flavobacteriales bacterium]
MSLEEVRNYINTVRRDFANRPLTESSIVADPFEQFAQWMEEAVNSQILDPYAMCVSTVGKDFWPSSRIVYLRDVAEGGFIFYTNYDSHKASDIAQHPLAAINFHWSELERQVRIEGTVEKVSEERSDAYWASRPRESQVSAWMSEQSQVVESREVLESRKADILMRFEGMDIPRPPHWGGYAVMPERIEFWQGRPNRLHDRLVYLRQSTRWKVVRLNP